MMPRLQVRSTVTPARAWGLGLIAAMLLAAAPAAAESDSTSIWREELGSSLRRNTSQRGISLGGGPGLRTLGSRRKHDLVLGSVHYGRFLGPNWALLGELFGGVELDSGNDLVVGIAPHLRYHFWTGGRWVPFIDGGAGLTYTTIGRPDLSTDFEFNLQGGIGTHYFYRNDQAVTLEVRWLHLSNAGIERPNRGVNTLVFYAGVTSFF